MKKLIFFIVFFAKRRQKSILTYHNAFYNIILSCQDCQVIFIAFENIFYFYLFLDKIQLIRINFLYENRQIFKSFKTS